MTQESRLRNQLFKKNVEARHLKGLNERAVRRIIRVLEKIELKELEIKELY